MLDHENSFIRETARLYQIALEYARLCPEDDEVWEELNQAKVRLEEAWLEWSFVA